MKKKFAAFVLISSFFLSAQHLNAETKWEFIDEKNSIKYYKAPVENSDFFQYKGVGIINAKIEVIGVILRDVISYKHWMHLCEEIKLIKDLGGDNDELIIYYVHNAPWPVPDRDKIVQTKSKIDRKNCSTLVSIHSIDYPSIPPEFGKIRMLNLEVKFLVEYIDRMNTKLTFHIKFEPGGILPAILTDIAMKSHPYHTIMGLRKMVKKEKYIEMAKTSKYRIHAEEAFKIKGK